MRALLFTPGGFLLRSMKVPSPAPPALYIPLRIGWIVRYDRMGYDLTYGAVVYVQA